MSLEVDLNPILGTVYLTRVCFPVCKLEMIIAILATS